MSMRDEYLDAPPETALPEEAVVAQVGTPENKYIRALRERAQQPETAPVAPPGNVPGENALMDLLREVTQSGAPAAPQVAPATQETPAPSDPDGDPFAGEQMVEEGGDVEETDDSGNIPTDQELMTLLKEAASVHDGVKAKIKESEPPGGWGAEVASFLKRSLLELDSWTTAGRIAAELAGSVAAVSPAGAAVKAIPHIPKWLDALVKAGSGSAVGSYVSEIFDPSKNMHKEALRAWVEGAGGEVVGRAFNKTVSKLISPLSGSISKWGSYAMSKVAEEGGQLTAGQILPETHPVGVMEGIANSVIVGGGKLTKVRETGGDAVEKMADDFVKRFGEIGDSESVGQLIQELVVNAVDAFKATAAAKYKVVDGLSKGAMVDITSWNKNQISLKGLAADIKNEMAFKGASPGTLSMIKEILELPDQIPFELASKWRSDLLMVSRGTANDLISSAAPANAKRLAKALDFWMEDAVKKTNPGAIEAFREASSFWKKNRKEFTSSFIKSLMTRESDKVFATVIKGQNPTFLKRLREYAGGDKSEAWKSIQGQQFLDFVYKSTDEQGNIIGNRLMRQIRRFQGREGRALKELFPNPKQRVHIKNIAKLLQTSGRAPTGGLFKFVVSSGQLGVMAVPLAQGSLSGTAGGAAVFILFPWMIGKVLSSPKAIRYLTNMTVSPTRPLSKAMRETKLTGPLGEAIKVASPMGQKRAHTAAAKFGLLLNQWENEGGATNVERKRTPYE
jgi:hypothetical protein